MALDLSHIQVKVEKPISGWQYQVGRFKDKLNAIADGFLKDGKAHYPNGKKITKYTDGHMAMELSAYCRAAQCKTKEQRIEVLDEMYHLCEKSPMGFTRAFWWFNGRGKNKTW